MNEKIHNFFLSRKDINFNTMKLLNSVFKKMSINDEASQSIINNLDVLSQYNITLDGELGIDSGVDSADDLSVISFFLASCASEVDAAHEFGHLLLDIFDRGNRPEEFDEVLDTVQQRLLKRKSEIREMLQGFSDEVYEDYLEHEDEFYQWVQMNPGIKKEFFRKNPGALDEDFEEALKLNFFANYTSGHENAMNYNKISNIIDCIFFNDGNFYESFGVDEFFPVLSMHDDEYFDNDPAGCNQVSFEEQFADYVALRLYGDRLGFATDVLHDILGEEWFEMMDKHYRKVASKISDRGKELVKK